MCVESDRAHVAFARHLQAPFPLVSDFNARCAFGMTTETIRGWWHEPPCIL